MRLNIPKIMKEPAARRVGLFTSFLLLLFIVGAIEIVYAQAEPSITIISAPSNAAAGQKITIEWEVKGTGKIAHTAVHYDTKPGNPADFRSYTKATPEFASINPPNDAPQKYSVSIDAPTSGTVYYVVHAIVDGKNIYNPEGEATIQIIAVPRLGGGLVQPPIGGAPEPQQPAAEQYSPPGPDITVLAIVGIIIVVGVIAFIARSRRSKE